MMKDVLVVIIVVINVLSFLTIGYDKFQAIRKNWRVPERVLLLLALLGGASGTLAGMYIFRHKTKQLVFKAGVPLILMPNLAFYYFLIFKQAG